MKNKLEYFFLITGVFYLGFMFAMGIQYDIIPQAMGEAVGRVWVWGLGYFIGRWVRGKIQKYQKKKEENRNALG